MLDDNDVKRRIRPVEEGRIAVSDEDRLMLVLAYLFPLSLIPLLLADSSAFVRWHARNGTALGLAAVVGGAILGAVPFIGFIFGACIWAPAVLSVDVVALVKALRGERWRIPGVTDLAEKF